LIITSFKNIINIKYLGIGDWGLGIGVWGVGGVGRAPPPPTPQPPIPNPQSPLKLYKKLFNILNK